jgi:hypothetical protein
MTQPSILLVLELSVSEVAAAIDDTAEHLARAGAERQRGGGMSERIMGTAEQSLEQVLSVGEVAA